MPNKKGLVCRAVHGRTAVGLCPTVPAFPISATEEGSASDKRSPVTRSSGLLEFRERATGLHPKSDRQPVFALHFHDAGFGSVSS